MLVSKVENKQDIKKFLSLPQTLYSKNKNTQDYKTEKQLLTNNHILSKYFTVHPYIIENNNRVVGRWIVTIYHNEKNVGYLGYVEMINNDEVIELLFSSIDNICNTLSIDKLIGPVNASFWIGYRLKTNNFNDLFVNEPYNKEYYQDAFLKANYQVISQYNSTIYHAVDSTYLPRRVFKNYKQRLGSNYHICDLEMDQFDKILKELYVLFTNLYSDFPTYKEITLDEFTSLFTNLKHIVHPHMIKLAYYNDQLVGFFISLPDYKNHLQNPLKIKNLYQILKIKKSPTRYVHLYMGVDRFHLGLGSALTNAIVEVLKENQLPSIGALIQDGKVSASYHKTSQIDINTYALYIKTFDRN